MGFLFFISYLVSPTIRLAEGVCKINNNVILACIVSSSWRGFRVFETGNKELTGGDKKHSDSNIQTRIFWRKKVDLPGSACRSEISLMVMYFRNLLLKYHPVCGCHRVSGVQHTGHLPSAYLVKRKIIFVSYFFAVLQNGSQRWYFTSSQHHLLKCYWNVCQSLSFLHLSSVCVDKRFLRNYSMEWGCLQIIGVNYTEDVISKMYYLSTNNSFSVIPQNMVNIHGYG